MIADTAAVLSTSPWKNDQFMGRDLFKCLEGLEMNMASLEAHMQQSCYQEPEPQTILHRESSASCSSSTSVASSECSDEPYIDLETDLGADSLFGRLGGSDPDYLNTSLLNILGSSSPDADSISLGAFDLSYSDLPCMSDILTSDTSSSIQSLSTEEVVDSPHPSTRPASTCSTLSSPQSPRKRTHSQSAPEHKKWNDMTNSEQVASIEELTKIISNEMDLREQLEVIRVISPSANIAPADSEFVIDLNILTNEKLEKLREMIREHSMASSCNTCGSSSTSSSPQQKRLTKKQRQAQQKEIKQRQRKEHRQMMKEKRSGLFGQEEVLALSHTDPDETGDIDIM